MRQLGLACCKTSVTPAWVVMSVCVYVFVCESHEEGWTLSLDCNSIIGWMFVIRIKIKNMMSS